MLHGFFVEESMAQIFQEALESYKAGLGVSNDEWLRHVHGKLGEGFEKKGFEEKNQGKKQPQRVSATADRADAEV
jgi:hypothetical protein